MSITTANTSNKTSQLFHNRAQWLWAALGVFLIGYGIFAFNAGSKLSPWTNPSQDNAEVTAYIIEQAESGVDMRGSKETEQTIPDWLNLMADVSSSEYAYGDDGLLELEHYFYTMPETRRTVISTHMMLGMVIMFTGFFQFWPAFRRRYRKAHRALGATYVVAALVSMSMSATHLINSGIANTYDTYAFHIGLWMMLIGVLVSVTMAGIAIFKKNIAQHMGWQAIGFGFMLTAPFQRLDWVITAPFAGDLSFNEMNTVVNTILFVQATLGGYALFLLNRASSPLRSTPFVFAPMSASSFKLGIAAIAACSLLWISPALMTTNLSELSLLQQMIPEQALIHMSTTVNGAFLIIFALSSFLLTISTWNQLHTLRNANTNTLSITTLVSGTVSGIIAITWGYKLGMPTHEHGIAGAGFMMIGVMLLSFSAMFTLMLKRNALGQAVEWLQFLFVTSLGPVIFTLSLWVLNVFDFVPEPYLSEAAGYEVAFIIAVFVPTLTGFIWSIYSDETKRYRVS